MKRPLVTVSMLSAVIAVEAGVRAQTCMMPVPSSRRVVFAAR